MLKSLIDFNCYNTQSNYFMQNEGMTGVISNDGVFSRLTFALLEDSGYVSFFQIAHVNK